MSIPRIPKTQTTLDTSYISQNQAPRKLPTKSTVSTNHSNDYMISISDEAKAILAQKNSLLLQSEQSSIVSEMLEQLNSTNNKSKDTFDDKLKCILIAIRIINGDTVPMKDRRFLAEKEPGMYSNAIMLRQKNDKPKKYKSLLQEEEEDSPVNLAKNSTSNELTIGATTSISNEATTESSTLEES